MPSSASRWSPVTVPYAAFAAPEAIEVAESITELVVLAKVDAVVVESDPEFWVAFAHPSSRMECFHQKPEFLHNGGREERTLVGRFAQRVDFGGLN